MTRPNVAEFPDGIERFDTPHGGEAQCARCGSSVEWLNCWNCVEGYTHHDCGEDCCCCVNPEDNVVCDECRGAGGEMHCISSPEWCEANPLPGREQVRSTALNARAWET
jgi:hypothetical protein